MNAREYLRGIPALVINVPTSTEKLQRFMSSTAPLFASTTVIPASPIVDVAQEAHEWRETVAATKRVDPSFLNLFERVNVFQAQDKTLQREKKQHEYAATRSLYLSTIHAMEYGLEQGWDSFILLEDDAIPRYEQMISSMTPPPLDTDLRVWGGAIPMGAHNHDDKQFLAGKDPKWKPIKTGAKSLYTTTAYEVTRRGAEMHHHALMTWPHAVDCSWWYTMAAIPSCRLDPVGFVQWGPSDRIDKTKNGAFSRDPA